MFLQIMWKINFNISNATTFAMRVSHQGSFNFRRPLSPNFQFFLQKTRMRSLWLTLKAFAVYRVCDSQFFHVHNILAFNIIEFPFTSLTLADSQTFT